MHFLKCNTCFYDHCRGSYSLKEFEYVKADG